MLHGGERLRGKAGFGNDRLYGEHIESVDLGKINPGHPVEVGAEIDERSTLWFLLPLFYGREGM